jgi:hypothetical protein
MRTPPASAAFFALLLVHLQSSTVLASPISPNLRVLVLNCITAPCTPVTTNDGSPLAVKQTLTAADGSTLTSDAGGSSTFGALGAGASIALELATPGTAFTLVESEFIDVLTIDSTQFAGQIGFLAVNYALDGTIAESGIVNSEAEVRIIVDRDGFGTGGLGEQSRNVHRSSASGLFAVPQLFTFAFGEPFNISTELDLALGTVQLGSGTPISTTSPVAGLGAGTADFSNTLRIASFAVFSPSMTPLDSATVTAGSGATYAIAAVPEPATLSLLGIGAALVRARRRRWRHSREDAESRA